MTKDKKQEYEGGIDLSKIDIEISDEDIKKFLQPYIEIAKMDEKSSTQYLNKLDVIQLIRDLADASEPMVSAPSYDYYRINASDTLEALHELKTYTNPERG